MKKKGFTLIELLAVIVVLAIIALIATPLVMNTIKNTQKGAAERSAENYIKGVETMIMEEKTKGIVVADGIYTINSDGNLCEGDSETCENPYLIEMSGERPAAGGKIAIENGKVVAHLTGDSASKTSISTKDGAYSIEINNAGRVVATGITPGGNGSATPSECFDFEPIYTYNIDYDKCISSFSGILEEDQTETMCSKDEYRDIDLLSFAKYFLGASKEDLVNGGTISDVTIEAGTISNVVETNDVVITNYKCGGNPSGNSDGQTGTVMDVVIPETVTINGQEKNVTAIGMRAFSTLDAFSGDLSTENTIINSIVIPNTINRMESYSFVDSGLKEITIPGSIKYIPVEVFMSVNENGNLEKVKISDGVEIIGRSAFRYNKINNLDLGNSVTSIGGNAFSDNQLTSVTIPSSVTSIGGRAFRNNKLESVTIPSSVTSIGNGAFYANQLTNVTIYKEPSASDCVNFGDYVFGIQSNSLPNPTITCMP